MAYQTFKVEYPDWGCEGSFKAVDMVQAAERAIEKWEWEACEFPCAAGDTRRIVVHDPLGISKSFNVTGRSEPVYTAKEVKSD